MTQVTDGVTDDIVGYKVQGCPGSIPGWVFKKEKMKKAHILYMYFIPYTLYILYIS